LQACVLDEAASNGWSTVDEVTALNCANSNITDFTGLEALTDLDTLDLSGNTDIRCADLDALEIALPNTTITRPATCDTGVTDSSQQVQNLHNAQGQRVVKTVNGDANTAIHFLYDQSGQVIAEIDATTGTTLREYIYVNGQQIAIVDDTGTQNEETYFVHNDHLGTPQKITDQTQEIVWDATYKPFGEVEVATAEIENNIRFPGQYADEETGLHYNYFRDYDPSTGRYVESDPIGLMGGNNLYSYALNSPLLLEDELGLMPQQAAVYFGVLEKYLRKELPIRRLQYKATAATGCFICVADCATTLAKSQIQGKALENLVERSTQRIAESFVKQGVRLVAKRVDLMSTMYDIDMAMACTINCFEN
jgi:RHS repeat-associated protein